MTKQDYELFASEIRRRTEYDEYGRDVTLLVNVCKAVFKRDNPRFNVERFTEACETGKHIKKALTQ